MGKGRVVTRTAVPRDPACSRGANGANPGGAAPNRQAREGEEGKGGEGEAADLHVPHRRRHLLPALGAIHPIRPPAS